MTVSNSAGSSGVSNTVTAMTEETGRDAQIFNRFISSTAPSGSPTEINEVAVTPNTLTVQWGEVSCLDHNGEITGYIVEAITSGEVVRTVNVNDSEARRATVTGLNSSTQYTVEVAAAVQTQGECGCCLCKSYHTVFFSITSCTQCVSQLFIHYISEFLMGTGAEFDCYFLCHLLLSH